MPEKLPALRHGGGPKSPGGKAASARNAVKHGLRGVKPADGREQQAMAVQIEQLTAHYGPLSPLEILQIQRIARCTVKLETLYAVEQAKSDLALLQAQATDDQIMAHFSHFPALACEMARQMLRQEVVVPPFGLTDRVLDALCAEMDGYTGLLQTEADLHAGFPKLRKHLQSTVIQGYEGPFSMDHRLWAVATLLKVRMDAANGRAISSAALSRYDQVLLKICAEDAFKVDIRSGVRPSGNERSYHARLLDDFAVFRSFRLCRRQAREIVARFPQVKTLVTTATTIPGDDADRLMRYQTTLEKQLSRHIGELLQLKAVGPAR